MNPQEFNAEGRYVGRKVVESVNKNENVPEIVTEELETV